MTRRWKTVLGYDCYQVSDDGLVVRVKTYGRQPKPVWKIMAKRPKMGGYVTYHLCRDNEAKDLMAHRLVWEAFKGRIKEGLEINHKNGDKTDNRLVNLEAITKSENMKHKFHVLNCLPNSYPSHGSKNGSAKLTEADIPKILDMYRNGIFQYEIARIFGVSQGAIGRIITGKGWKHTNR